MTTVESPSGIRICASDLVAIQDSEMRLDGGERLSGGQRQRIAIARALLKNAPVLLLDEATANVDLESEAEIQSALSELMRDRTVLVTAHRLWTITEADEIWTLDSGRLVERGTHANSLLTQAASIGDCGARRSARVHGGSAPSQRMELEPAKAGPVCPANDALRSWPSAKLAHRRECAMTVATVLLTRRRDRG